MKLEDEIRQKSFKSPQQKLAVNILFTAGWLNSKYAIFFRETDITPPQFNVLRILRGQHPGVCSLKLIKERMLDPVSDASRIVDKLVKKGFVSRKQCNDDRRSLSLLITSHGLKMLEKLDFIDDEVQEIFKNLNTTEVRMLNDLMDRLRD
jgi:DNA-binding MarR family transcriptional regulator